VMFHDDVTMILLPNDFLCALRSINATVHD
jgi:hypothetical protein